MGLPASVEEFVRASPIYRRPIAELVARVADETAAESRVLDAGAGTAPYRPLFSHCRYVTQDWSGSLHTSVIGPDIVADLAALPVPDRQFDLVLCTEVLEHVLDPAAVLTEIHRVTAIGGLVVITVPFVIELHEEPYDHFRYTSHGLRALMQQAGFEAVDVGALAGWFSTLAAVLRNAGLAMRPRDSKVPWRTWAASLGLLGLSEPIRRLAPLLDRLDARRALPTGWVATARRGE